jgi:hypothetical protein
MYFSNMYTSIPLDDLKAQLALVLKEAWMWQADKLGVSDAAYFPNKVQSILFAVEAWESRVAR